MFYARGELSYFMNIFLYANWCISIQVSLKLVPKGPIENKPALIQWMVWRRSVRMMAYVYWPHICVFRYQWIKIIVCKGSCSIRAFVFNKPVNKPVVVIMKILNTYWISCWRRFRRNLTAEAPTKYENDNTIIKDIWTQIYYHADVLYGDIDKLYFNSPKTHGLVICGQTMDKHITRVKDACCIILTWYDPSRPLRFVISIFWS